MPTLEAPLLRNTPFVVPLLSRIVLIGFMGAGKSTVGRMLASSMGWKFIDTDACVEQKYGNTIAGMFASEGESVFRRRESAALARALGTQQSVIAVGGGAPEMLTNRLLLEQTPCTAVIFLDAPFAVLLDRCVLQEDGAVRPVLTDTTAAEHRFKTRGPAYRQCARHSISTELLSPESATEHILKLLTR